MSKEHKIPFELKHKGKTVDSKMEKTLQELVKENRITCADAHKAAESRKIPVADIGVQIDLLGFRITKCQLGLFGYKEKKLLDPDIEISSELSARIDVLAESGRISCSDCWEIAKSEGMSRLDMGSACEKKGLKIKPCQLGAF